MRIFSEEIQHYSLDQAPNWRFSIVAANCLSLQIRFGIADAYLPSVISMQRSYKPQLTNGHLSVATLY